MSTGGGKPLYLSDSEEEIDFRIAYRAFFIPKLTRSAKMVYFLFVVSIKIIALIMVIRSARWQRKTQQKEKTKRMFSRKSFEEGSVI